MEKEGERRRWSRNRKENASILEETLRGLCSNPRRRAGSASTTATRLGRVTARSTRANEEATVEGYSHGWRQEALRNVDFGESQGMTELFPYNLSLPGTPGVVATCSGYSQAIRIVAEIFYRL